MKYVSEREERKKLTALRKEGATGRPLYTCSPLFSPLERFVVADSIDGKEKKRVFLSQSVKLRRAQRQSEVKNGARTCVRVQCSSSAVGEPRATL